MQANLIYGAFRPFTFVVESLNEAAVLVSALARYSAEHPDNETAREMLQLAQHYATGGRV